MIIAYLEKSQNKNQVNLKKEKKTHPLLHHKHVRTWLTNFMKFLENNFSYKQREPESNLFTFIILLFHLLTQHYEGSEHLCANIFLFPRKMTSEKFTGIISIYLIGVSWKYPLTFTEFFEFFKWKTLHKSKINTFKSNTWII